MNGCLPKSQPPSIPRVTADMNDPAETSSTPEAPAPEKAAASNARAEELMDQFGERLGYFAAMLSRRTRWIVARTCEEAEDIWAEAQNIRRNKRS